MADEKLNTGPEAAKTEEPTAPVAADPARSEATAPEHQPEQTGPAELGDVVISADQIDALMADKRRAARAEVEKAETPPEQEAGAPATEHPAAEKGEPEKPRRGRPPKSEKAEHTEAESEKAPKKAGPRKGRPSKADKAAPGEAQPSKRDKLGVLTKRLFNIKPGIVRRKKDTFRRQVMAQIILLRFKAVAERRQWSSAASKPRRKTRVKLWHLFWMAKVPSHQICRCLSACL